MSAMVYSFAVSYLSLKLVSLNCSAAVLFSYRFIYHFKVMFKKILIHLKFVYTSTNLDECVMCVPVSIRQFSLSVCRETLLMTP